MSIHFNVIFNTLAAEMIFHIIGGFNDLCGMTGRKESGSFLEQEQGHYEGNKDRDLMERILADRGRGGVKVDHFLVHPIKQPCISDQIVYTLSLLNFFSLP